MAEDNLTEPPTEKLTPFQTMVIARFDEIAASQRETNERLEKLDTNQQETNVRLEKLEARTTPIWERALAEILEVKAEVNDRFSVLQEMFLENTEQMRLRHRRLEKRVDELQPTKPSQ